MVQRLPAAPVAGAGTALLLLVSVALPGRKMAFGFGGEAAAGGVARYFNEGAEAAAAPPAVPGGSPDQFHGKPLLPRFAAPRRYDLRLRPDLVACTFTGAACNTRGRR